MYKRLTVVLLWFAFGVPAQENIQDIRRQTKSVEKETQQEKDIFQTEKKRHQDFLEVSRKKQASLEDQAATLRGQIDSLKAEAARLDEARQVAAGKSHWVDARKQKYQESLARNIDTLAQVLAMDIPFRNEESVDAMKETANQLRKGMVPPEEALGRAFDIVLERIQMGYTTETWSGYFAWNGRSISGKFVRYGGVAALFVAQDGEEIFWLLKGEQGYEWKPVGMNIAMRAALKETLKVAEGKAPPSLVMLPFAMRKPEVK